MEVEVKVEMEVKVKAKVEVEVKVETKMEVEVKVEMKVEMVTHKDNKRKGKVALLKFSNPLVAFNVLSQLAFRSSQVPITWALYEYRSRAKISLSSNHIVQLDSFQIVY
ncbi:hypothetical protein M8J77_009555 [Diaphorina citri]|nr:hypothetical protein M8J77_009555 [Diaphorina citri]